MFIKKIKRILKEPKLIFLNIIGLKIFRKLPDKIFISIKYYLYNNKALNLKNPKTFNEKLQWLKLYDRKDIYTTWVDKYLVRNYIAEVLGEEVLIPLYGVYDSFEEIKFDELPNQFVIKPNHTSGDVFICKNKDQIDKKELKSEINRWLKREYYWIHREWPYKNIKPRIITEKYMIDNSGEELRDYKFMCFNGIVKCCFICSNRNSENGLNIDIYDKEWNLMKFTRQGHGNSKVIIEKPINYNLMIEFAEKLSKNMPFIRVDFYEINNKLYFGELTFFPAAGFEKFEPEEYDYILGEWLKLPYEYDGQKS